MVEAVNLVHKEDVALLEVGEYGSEVSRARDSRTRRSAKASTHLVGDHVGKRGLSQPRRTGEEHVVEGLVAVFSSCDKHAKVIAHPLLAAVLVERGRAKAPVDI